MTGASELRGGAAAAAREGAPAAAVVPGWIVWITGLSGSGKTAVARELVALLRASAPNTLLLDGDELRAALAGGSDHSLAARRRWAERYARLSALFAGQGLHVVVATISMFEGVRRSNRARHARYLEVYLRAPLDVLRRRDERGVYRSGRAVGVDLPWEEPACADLVCDASGAHSPAEIAAEVWRALAPRVRDER